MEFVSALSSVLPVMLVELCVNVDAPDAGLSVFAVAAMLEVAPDASDVGLAAETVVCVPVTIAVV